MFVRISLCAAFLGGAHWAGADVVQLKDKAAVTGKILAEKRDMLVLDVGYTVLTIPKSAISRVTRDADAEPKETKARPSGNSPRPHGD